MAWPWKRGVRAKRSDPAQCTTDVGDECEAFLSGCLDRYLTEHGRPVPDWARLNRLAHATEAELWRMAGALDPPPWEEPEWSRAVAILAGALHYLSATTGRSLRQLQDACLVPLELRLIGGRGAHAAIGPEELIGTVLAELQRPDRCG